MWYDNKVRELATVSLPWQQWTETSVWFDDTGISAFLSCVVVDLWKSACVWCAVVRTSELLVNFGKSGSEKQRDVSASLQG
jgi:hypothetical protein